MPKSVTLRQAQSAVRTMRKTRIARVLTRAQCCLGIHSFTSDYFDLPRIDLGLVRFGLGFGLRASDFGFGHAVLIVCNFRLHRPRGARPEGSSSLYYYMESKKRFGPSGAQIFQAAFANPCKSRIWTATFFAPVLILSEPASRENATAWRLSLLRRFLMARVDTFSLLAKSSCFESPAPRHP